MAIKRRDFQISEIVLTHITHDFVLEIQVLKFGKVRPELPRLVMRLLLKGLVAPRKNFGS